MRYRFIYKDVMCILETKFRKDRKSQDEDAYKYIIFKKYVERILNYIQKENFATFLSIEKILIMGVRAGNYKKLESGVQFSLHENRGINLEIYKNKPFFDLMKIHFTRYGKKVY